MTQVWTSKTQKRVAVVSGVRTPFAKAGTKLKDTSAVHLGTTVVKEALAQLEWRGDAVDEVVFGNAGTPAGAANISRVIALRSGIPENVPAYTVHRNCASAMEAVAQGCLKIGAGMAETMVVGGTESMSNMPLIYKEDVKDFFGKMQFARRWTDKVNAIVHLKPQSFMKPVVAIMEGLTDPISGLNMGQTAEILARDFHITRKEQDEFAVRSHLRCVAAAKAGKYKDEVFAVITEPKYKEAVFEDIGPRDGQSMEALSKLRPFFDRENGTVTPGNACPITDGAVALVLMNEDKAKAEGRQILGTISAFTFSGLEPKRMGLGPVYATSQILDATGLQLKDIPVVELNEAFAAQVIANQRAFASKQFCVEKLGRKEAIGELSDDVLNVNGGAIALGHPVGATGARLVLTALLEMKRSNKNKGLATLCIGGGQGAAFLLERA